MIYKIVKYLGDKKLYKDTFLFFLLLIFLQPWQNVVETSAKIILKCVSKNRLLISNLVSSALKGLIG